ncbi:MAG: hypothetical protein QME71_04180 [Dehalococcoidia bacterium]|nr:hypothetical protein [Dehalococcoidia bacterium]
MFLNLAFDCLGGAGAVKGARERGPEASETLDGVVVATIAVAVAAVDRRRRRHT